MFLLAPGKHVRYEWPEWPPNAPSANSFADGTYNIYQKVMLCNHQFSWQDNHLMSGLRNDHAWCS